MLHQLSYWINKTANWQIKLCALFIVITGTAMTVIILLQVFFRFVVYMPFPWSEEAARFLMIWMAMFGSVIAFRRGRHIGVRVLVERMPPGFFDRYLAPLIQLSILAFLCTMGWQGWQFAMRSRFQISPALEMSMVYAYMAIPVGMAMMALDVAADLLQDRFPTEAGSNAKISTTALDDLDELAAAARQEIERGRESAS